MNIQSAVKEDIPYIFGIIKQRCEWFEKNNIEQWGSWYYTELYNEEHFLKVMKKYQLYVVKEDNEIIGTFLLKNKNEEYWNDKGQDNAYYRV